MPSCEQVLASFSATTSFHGVPHIASSRSKYWRLFWTAVCFLCLGIFIYQLVPTVQRYYRYDKVMEIRINFERIPFPAVTICNLNPYKRSAVKNNVRIEELVRLNVACLRHLRLITWHLCIHHMETYQEAQSKHSDLRSRPKRSTVARRFTYDHRWCTCTRHKADLSCESLSTEEMSIDNDSTDSADASSVENATVNVTMEHLLKPGFWSQNEDNETKLCICVIDTVVAEKVFSCYPRKDWQQRECKQCYATSGHCAYPDEAATTSISKKSYLCTCAIEVKMCLFNHGEHVEMDETWKPTHYPPTEQEIRWKKMERYGYDKIEDRSSIQSRAVQNLITIASEEPEETRENMSYTREETIRSCSYGGSDCNITKDFTLHTDPGYGNCYTFNEKAQFQAARPGALFGLRVFLYTDKSEYLPTTESMGVKISIHDQIEYPFPDTFGYNAPVGFLSSFAVQAQKIEALPHPYGDCINLNSYNYTKEGYLYGRKYSIEGCQRSCLQHQNIQYCSCADPRIPHKNETPICQADEPDTRVCLEMVAKRFLDNPNYCNCGQPCQKTNYQVSFSSAIWPSESSRGTLCPVDKPMCIEDYREQGSFVEVYFQQVNYQLLREHEAYGWVNLMSDFGGQISLFLGASVITTIEVAVFLVRLFTSIFCCKKEEEPDLERNETEIVNQTYFVNGDSYALRTHGQTPYWEGD